MGEKKLEDTKSGAQWSASWVSKVHNGCGFGRSPCEAVSEASVGFPNTAKWVMPN